MSVDAVIFDWGGTLTPWHTLELMDIWRTICTAHIAPEQVEKVATALVAAEMELWERGRVEHRSGTLAEIFELAGVESTEALLETKFETWTPHTFIDPDVPELLKELRGRGIKVGVLSNTVWPRAWHERIFARDDVLDLLDGAVYSSEIPWTKPHVEAFRAAMAAVGVSDPASCVFVGDRPFDDIHGAKSAGMRAVLVPNDTVPKWDSAVPDATITRLSELLPHVERWSA